MIVIWTVTCIPTDAQMALSPHSGKALATLCRLSGDAPAMFRRCSKPKWLKASSNRSPQSAKHASPMHPQVRDVPTYSRPGCLISMRIPCKALRMTLHMTIHMTII